MDCSKPQGDCEWVALQLSELRDGSLAPSQEAVLRSHLASCASCREEAACEDHLAALLHAAPLPTSHSVSAEAVWQRVQRRRWLRNSTAVAAAGLLLAAILVWQHGHPSFQAPGGSEPARQLVADGPGDVLEAPVLFAAPPVDSLELIARQQAGLMSVLHEMEKGETP